MLPRLCEYEVKNCVPLPAVGKQNATFSSDFTQPGRHSLEVPCMIIHDVGEKLSLSVLMYRDFESNRD